MVDPLKITGAGDETLVLGIDPGPVRPTAPSAWSVLSLHRNTGRIDIVRPATAIRKTALRDSLVALLSFPDLRLVCLGAPLTPLPLAQKPLRARSVEIRLSRGAFSASERGPGMPWIATPRLWPHYVQARPLQEALEQRGFPLITLPADIDSVRLPSRCTTEVFPKASLALLTSHKTLRKRPLAGEFCGQLDDWSFPRLFTEMESSPPPIQACLQALSPGLHLAPEALAEARRIAAIRRPYSRREPLRAFVAALQGVVALRGGACLVGAPGDHEGSILLPATWHPDWEAEWRINRRIFQVHRYPVEEPDPSASLPPPHESLFPDSRFSIDKPAAKPVECR